MIKANNRKVEFTELVLRDGHQSLIATRMRTEDMLPACANLDQSGFWSIECWGGATFDACVRYLREDPWQRLRKLRKEMPNSRLQMLLRGQNLLGYRHYGAELVGKFIRNAADAGIDVIRIFDAMNDFNNVRIAIEQTIKANLHAQGTICYTTSPVHDNELFLEFAQKCVDAGCHSIAIKDMAGIMSPHAGYELVSLLKNKLGVQVHVHSHHTSGMADMTLLRCVQAGADVIDTCISAFSQGASHPATETMVQALLSEGYEVSLDQEKLKSLDYYFADIRKKYWQFESNFTGVDPNVISHHVPGGMISNLSNQLAEQKALDKISAVLAEIPRVRQDLGYPPLVTPTSQIVGAQAVLNVLSEKRYGTISKEVRAYLQGEYGQIPAPVSQDLLMQLPDEKIGPLRPALDGEFERLTSEIGAIAQDEKDVLTYAMFPQIGKQFLQERAAMQLKPEKLLPIEQQVGAREASDESDTPTAMRVTIHGETFDVKLTGSGAKQAAQRSMYFEIDGVSEEVLLEITESMSGSLSHTKEAGGRPPATSENHLSTVMPGTVIDVLVKEGDEVSQGQHLMVIEAMKMENPIVAPFAGTIAEINADTGDTVKPGERLVALSR